MKVKICGLTNKEDAFWSLNYGADYLGINFAKESPRHNSIQTAEKWVSLLPPFAVPVGIFVDSTVEEIVHTFEKLNLKGIQLHGQESKEFVMDLKNRFGHLENKPFIIKAFKLQTESDIETMRDFKGVIDYALLDTKVENAEGGTGQTFDWSLGVKAKEVGIPLILAGGLNPKNVRQAIKKVNPFGVDVASGVEKSPRKKDIDKIRDFIMSAKG